MSTPIYDIDTPYESDLYVYNNFNFIYDGAFEYEENGVEYSGYVTQSSLTSTLSQELNRLANGGTYRSAKNMVGQALAARQWAVQRNVNTNLTDTVGVLNALDNRTDKNDFLDFNGICNALAGTTQLPAAQALRSIES